MKIEDFRFSSSSIDDFFQQPNVRTARVASGGRIRIAGLSDLAGFRFVAEDKLVRLSKQDFWQLGEDEEGPFIECLVDDGEGPVID